MTEIIRPETQDQLKDAVEWAVAHSTPLEVIGTATKRPLGNPVDCEHVLDLSGLWGIVQYEPSELVMTARAGTKLSEIKQAIAENHQGLDFEPIDFANLLGEAPDASGTTGTIGGMIGAGFAGPRRIKQGSVRDHLLGFKAISGRGELFKSGGQVMKNVTGFDLSKLMAGSFGTLAVLSEVSFKVMPTYEKSRTVLISGLGDNSAISAMSVGMNSAFEVSSAAHLPGTIAAKSSLPLIRDAHSAITAIRVEGPAPSVTARCEALRGLLGKFGDLEELHTKNSEKLWAEIRDIDYFGANDDALETAPQIWRVSVAPSSGAAFARQVIDECGGEALFDWGGGQVWLALPATENAAQDHVRTAVNQCGGGHATLMRASVTVRQNVSVFQPADPILAALNARVKDSFDPKNILNPSRM